MISAYLAIVKDGKIELIDSLSIPEGTKVLITPILSDDDIENRPDWEYFSLKNLNHCYGENEPEYTLESIKEYNNHYERR
ncbi:MAG: glycosyl hydrolase family 31 [Gloeotrichia echinulata HAB0833]